MQQNWLNLYCVLSFGLAFKTQFKTVQARKWEKVPPSLLHPVAQQLAQTPQLEAGFGAPSLPPRRRGHSGSALRFPA